MVQNLTEKGNSMYDLHIATEGNKNVVLRAKLTEMGFTDDNLVEPWFNVNQQTRPRYEDGLFYDLHLSLKPIGDRNSLKKSILQMQEVLQKHGPGESGYWHAEWTAARFLLEGAQSQVKVPFFCEPFEALPRLVNKRWDIHLRVVTSAISHEEQQRLLECGFYYITRRGPEGDWYSFTIQGTNDPREGRRLFDEIKKWWRASGFPALRGKFETTTHQVRFGTPKLIPPTISEIKWR